MEIHIVVPDELPPAKSEAKSLWSSNHPKSQRVRALLAAAADAMAGRRPLAGPIGMEVHLHAPARVQLQDATNVLGGIGDVLQKPRGPDVEHLGSLSQVHCYDDDAQIHEISYRRTTHGSVSYEVRLWELRHDAGSNAPNSGGRSST